MEKDRAELSGKTVPIAGPYVSTTKATQRSHENFAGTSHGRGGEPSDQRNSRGVKNCEESANANYSLVSQVDVSHTFNCSHSVNFDLLNEFVLYYQNVRGLNTKINILSSSLYISDYDALIFTETWLKNSTYNSELLDLDIFNVYRDDRVDRIGGGVLLAIKTRYVSGFVNLTPAIQSTPHINIIACKIQLVSFSFILVAIYITPSISLYEFEEFFESLSGLCSTWSTNFMIVGDFIVPNLIHYVNSGMCDSKSSILQNFMDIHHLCQYNDIYNINNRYLDLAIATFPCEVKSNDLLLLPVDTHHPPFVIQFETTKISSSMRNNFLSNIYDKKYKFKGCNLKDVKLSLLNTDWSLDYNIDNVDVLVNLFYKKLYKLIEEHIGVISQKKENLKYPKWYNSNIINSIKTKDKLRQLYKKSGLQHYLNEFHFLRHEIKMEIKKAHANYLSTLENEIIRNPSSIWHISIILKNLPEFPELCSIII